MNIRLCKLYSKQDGLLNKNKKKGNESELYNNIIILKYYNIIF